MRTLTKRFTLLAIVAALVLTVTGMQRASAQKVTEITFTYSVAVNGPIPKIIQGYADEFNQANPDIHVTPDNEGDYGKVFQKIQTGISGGGTPPDVAILLSTDMYTMIDSDYIISFDDLIKNMKDGDKYLADFYPAFLLNSQAYGKTWGIPFQRSTPVLYYNKDMFKAAGLDPEKAPATWQELRDDAKKLTNTDAGVWGIKIPSDGFPYWLFQGFAISNGQNVVGDASNKVFFNTPSTVEALQFFSDLANKDKVMPTGTIIWGDTPTDFTSGKAAMIYHTTGSLTSILKNAKFPVGVGFLPAGKTGYGAPTGGGNLYIFKDIPAENQAAAWRFIQFLTSPEKEADWTKNVGYIAPRKSAWDTDTLKQLVADKPQYAVARDQLQYAAKELASHRSADIQQILGKAIQNVVTTGADPKQSLDDAQKAADAILSGYSDAPAAPSMATMAPTMAATATK